MKRTVIVEGDKIAKRRNKNLIFKNNAPFRSRIWKINNTFLDNTEDLDIIIPIYNLLKYTKNYSKTTGTLWNYYRDEINDGLNENNASNNRTNNNKTITSKYFEYKTRLIGSTANNNNTLNAEVVVPLKDLSNFWRSLDSALINCKIEIDYSLLKESIISEISITHRIPPNLDANPLVQEVEAIQKTGAIFQINNVKLYVPVVTLSIDDNKIFLEDTKQGFKGTISWNKYKSEIATQRTKNDFDYLIHPIFRNINRLFVLSLKSDNNDLTRN